MGKETLSRAAGNQEGIHKRQIDILYPEMQNELRLLGGQPGGKSTITMKLTFVES